MEMWLVLPPLSSEMKEKLAHVSYVRTNSFFWPEGTTSMHVVRFSVCTTSSSLTMDPISLTASEPALLRVSAARLDLQLLYSLSFTLRASSVRCTPSMIRSTASFRGRFEGNLASFHSKDSTANASSPFKSGVSSKKAWSPFLPLALVPEWCECSRHCRLSLAQVPSIAAVSRTSSSLSSSSESSVPTRSVSGTFSLKLLLRSCA
mmetsp:Transcript_19418/g.40865  ORF Transcript_19418/g.40865 Transcript_19418/m.40865 type:complete len:205 (-) Transcript_19418:190-804(-)